MQKNQKGDLETSNKRNGHSLKNPYGNVNIKCRKNNESIEAEIIALAEVEIVKVTS